METLDVHSRNKLNALVQLISEVVQKTPAIVNRFPDVLESSPAKDRQAILTRTTLLKHLLIKYRDATTANTMVVVDIVLHGTSDENKQQYDKGKMDLLKEYVEVVYDILINPKLTNVVPESLNVALSAYKRLKDAHNVLNVQNAALQCAIIRADAGDAAADNAATAVADFIEADYNAIPIPYNAAPYNTDPYKDIAYKAIIAGKTHTDGVRAGVCSVIAVGAMKAYHNAFGAHADNTAIAKYAAEKTTQLLIATHGLMGAAGLDAAKGVINTGGLQANIDLDFGVAGEPGTVAIAAATTAAAFIEADYNAIPIPYNAAPYNTDPYKDIAYKAIIAGKTHTDGVRAGVCSVIAVGAMKAYHNAFGAHADNTAIAKYAAEKTTQLLIATHGLMGAAGLDAAKGVINTGGLQANIDLDFGVADQPGAVALATAAKSAFLLSRTLTATDTATSNMSKVFTGGASKKKSSIKKKPKKRRIIKSKKPKTKKTIKKK